MENAREAFYSRLLAKLGTGWEVYGAVALHSNRSNTNFHSLRNTALPGEMCSLLVEAVASDAPELTPYRVVLDSNVGREKVRDRTGPGAGIAVEGGGTPCAL